MNKIDLALKDFLEQRKFEKRHSPVSAEYPSADDFYRFIHDELETAELERMLDHLKAHPEDQTLVAQARGLISRLQEADSETAPAASVQRAQSFMGQTPTLKCPHCGKPITPFKQPLKRQWLWNGLWLALAILSFALSFFIPRYFYQCLVAAFLFGVQWIVGQRAQKTQILIYKALQQEERESLHRLSSHL